MTIPVAALGEPLWARESTKQWSQSSSLPFDDDWEGQLLVSILRLAELPHDWNSYGSPPPTSAAKSAATNLVGMLNAIRATFPALPTPYIAPVPSGGIQFEWRLGDRELELEILRDGSVEFLQASGRAFCKEGPLRPGWLRSLIAWLTEIR